jgi:lysophospholipase L1-like esterase
MSQQLVVDNFSALLKNDLAQAATSAVLLPVGIGESLPNLTDGNFIIMTVSENVAPSKETHRLQLKVTSVNGDTITFDPSDEAWPAGSKIQSRLGAAVVNPMILKNVPATDAVDGYMTKEDHAKLTNAAAKNVPATDTADGYMTKEDHVKLTANTARNVPATDTVSGYMTAADHAKLSATAPAIVRGVGLSKPHGSQAQVIEAWNTPTYLLKMEMEAPFSRVRIWVFNRNPLGSSNWEFAVAATENGAPDSNVANTFYPTKGGVVNNALQDATHEFGWNRVTFGGGGPALSGMLDTGLLNNYQSGKLYPSTEMRQSYEQSGTMQATGDALVSDWVNCQSIAPKVPGPAGYNRPFLLIRSHCLNGGFALEKTDNYVITAAQSQTEYNEWAAGNKARRLVYARGLTGGDPTTTFTIVPTGAQPPDGTLQSQNYPYIGVEVEYTTKVRSFACFGDSNTEGYAWPFAAIAQMSVPEAPYTWANFGMSTNRSVQYFSMMDMVLKKGLRPTDVLFPSHSSNDNPTTVYDYDQLRVQMLERIKLCNDLGITPWIWTHFYGVVNGPTGVGNLQPEADYLNWIRALCATGKAKLVDIAAGWVRATMRSGDNTHPNATGVAYCTDVFLNALKAG